MTVTLYAGVDTREAIADLPDASVDLIACSPPFLALRNYGTGDEREIGQERNPAEFLRTLLALTDQWARALAPHGSIAIELGDTFSGSGGAGGDYADDGWREGQATFRQTRGNGWPQAKSLCGIPTLYAWSLAYGRNLLTGEPCEQWIVRNVIVWARPNPAVGALGDKVRPAVSYITVATRSARRWFDIEAVRSAPSATTHARTARGVEVVARDGKSGERGNFATMAELHETAGAPPHDDWTDTEDHEAGDLYWKLSTSGSPLAHFAMWPPTLADRLVRLMCPLEVCRTCGEPRRRITRTEYVGRNGAAVATLHMRDGERRDEGVNQWDEGARGDRTAHAVATTLGWTTCGCAGGRATTWRIERSETIDDNGDTLIKNTRVVDDPGTPGNDYRPGIVLEPFAGTGTSCAVAELAGRDSIGIDLNPNLTELYPKRLVEVRKKLFKVEPEVAGQMELL